MAGIKKKEKKKRERHHIYYKKQAYKCILRLGRQDNGDKRQPDHYRWAFLRGKRGKFKIIIVDRNLLMPFPKKHKINCCSFCAFCYSCNRVDFTSK